MQHFTDREPILVAPALSVLTSQLQKRPEWQRHDPLKAPRELYDAGLDEMRAIMKKRGLKLPVSLPLLKNGQDNFLLFGTPIICL